MPSMDSFLQNELLKLDDIYNPPFNISAIQTYLKKSVEDLNFSLESNQYYSYVHVASNPDAPKLILFCHTDHPAFIFKNSNSGILFGKFNMDQIKTKLPIDIDVFDKKGEMVFKEKIVSISGREFITSSKFKAKPNYSSRFHIKEERLKGVKLGMYSADNYLGVYSLLHLLKNKKISESKFDLYFVFNHHEEVFQLGSMKFCMDNVLGINDKDILINIDTWREDSDNKLLLQVLEKGCVYSKWSDKPNLAEHIAITSALKGNIDFDIGTNTGSGDGRIIDRYKLTPNLISIGIPRDKYHNISQTGAIGYEVVSLPTFKKLLNWLEGMCFVDLNELDEKVFLTNRSKLEKYHDNEFLSNSFDENMKVFDKYQSAVERGYFFHENIIEKLLYKFKSILKKS